MRTTIFSLALLLATSAVAAESQVVQVVVYADRAEVTREASSPCADGQAAVPFPGLPRDLDARTLRADARAPAKAVGVSHRLVNVDDAQRDVRVVELEQQLDALEAKLEVLTHRRASIKERGALAKGYGGYFLAVFEEEMRNARPRPERWAAALDLLDDETDKAARELVAISTEQRKLSRQHQLLERQHSRFKHDGTPERLDAEVAVSCSGGSARASLSYVVPGATWHPEYDLRFSPGKGKKVGKGKVELTVAAVIQQATGEDWSKARLQLSTAKPRLGSEAPELAPLYVDGSEAGKQRVLVQGTERRQRLEGSKDRGGGGPQSAELDDRGQSFMLKLPRAVTVKSDGRPYWFPVDVIKASATASLVTVPKLRPYVYQLVKLDNPAAYPLLAGRVHVYRRGAFVGDAHLRYRAPGEPMEVSLGVDEEFKVERVDLKEQDKKGHFISGEKQMLRAYRITVKNRSRQKLPVEVRENIPVSKVKDVRVELHAKKSTKGYKLDREQGFVTWRIRPKPGKGLYVDLAYTIHLPKEWKVR